MLTALRAFWHRAYRENLTGLSGMVAFNMLLAVFPFALLVLFVFGQVIRSPDAELSVLRDLQIFFPDAEQDTLRRALDRIRDQSTEIGVVAVLGSVWIGASFWGSMDTAFCRIYHVECRGWVEQKRWSLAMLLVVALFFAASVLIPAIEGLVFSSLDDLPFGLSEIGAFDNAALIAGAAVLSFGVLSVIYWAVPKGHMPWRAVWPGALFATIVSGIANALFPIYLVNLSAIGEFGGIVGFVVVAMVWFYVLSLTMLAGAVINALRHELRVTGTLREWPPPTLEPRGDGPCSGDRG